MVPPTLTGVLASQRPSGAFPAVVRFPDGRQLPDENGFITAQVLRALEEAGLAESEPAALERALDYLERCQSATRPGAYRFWPPGEAPAWAAELPDDVDDTAVLTQLLHRHDRLTTDQAIHTACTILAPARLRPTSGLGPPWRIAGAFVTWLTPQPDPVLDACVNVNVLALFATLGTNTLPGYTEAVNLLSTGLHWAATHHRSPSCLSPFYPNPLELRRAIHWALRFGATELRDAARLFDLHWPEQPDRPASVCSSAYGAVQWFAPALKAARALST